MKVTFKLKRKIIYIFITVISVLSFQSIIAQTVNGVKVFGQKWVTHDLEIDSNGYHLDKDSITFFRMPFNFIECSYLVLDSTDSTFRIWSYDSFTFDNSIRWYVGYAESSDCTLKYELRNDTIRFNICNQAPVTYTINMGMKATDTRVYYTNTGYYRRHMVLKKL